MPARRQIRLVLALLLPLMLLRALLPPGYMPVAREGELHFVMCSAGLAAPAATDDTAPPAAPGIDCPYAFAHGVAFAPPVLPLFAFAPLPQATRFIAIASEHLPRATGPPRTTTVRGPPTLS